MTPAVDAHAHAWDPAAVPIDWVRGTALEGPRLPGMLDDADRQIDRWIFVEADVTGSGEQEVAWVRGLDWPGLIGIVADIDLTAADLAHRLDRLHTADLVCGVRHLLQGEDLTGNRLDDLAAGLQLVSATGLAFDVCVRWQQLAAVAELTRRAPGVRFVVDHLGKPPVDAGIDSGDGAAWLAMMQALAANPDAHVKLSGLRSEASTRATLMANGPGFLAAAVALFGARRCIFGTDWPLSVGADTDLDAATWLALVQQAAGDHWPVVADRAARQFYRLP